MTMKAQRTTLGFIFLLAAGCADGEPSHEVEIGGVAPSHPTCSLTMGLGDVGLIRDELHAPTGGVPAVVQGDLKICANTEGVDLSVLGAIERVDGYIYISRNSGVEEFDALNALRSAHGLIVNNNAGLKRLRGFSSFEKFTEPEATGSLSTAQYLALISEFYCETGAPRSNNHFATMYPGLLIMANNVDLLDIDTLPNLEGAAEMRLDSNTALTSLRVAPRAESLEWAVFAYMGNLETIDAFSASRSQGVAFDHVEKLRAYNGPRLRGGELGCHALSLQNVPDLESMTMAAGAENLEVWLAGSVGSIQGLDGVLGLRLNLHHVENEFIGRAAALPGLSYLGIYRMQDLMNLHGLSQIESSSLGLRIEANPKLETMNHVEGRASWRSITVLNNPMLPTCEVEDFLGATVVEADGGAVVSGNNNEAVCSE